MSDHVFELSDGTRAAATEVFDGAMVVETILEKVDDLLVGDIDYRSALIEKRRMYLRSVSPCSYFTIARSMQVPERPMHPQSCW
jgi:hypothetical protein